MDIYNYIQLMHNEIDHIIFEPFWNNDVEQFSILTDSIRYNMIKELS